MKTDTATYFVTTNKKKFLSLQSRLGSQDIVLKQLEYDFDEGRSLNIRSVANYKMQQAKKAFPNKRLIVDDRGFFIPALNGFPGPFVKLVLDSFSYRGLLKLMNGEHDRRAFFSYAVSYYDGIEEHIFVADEEGYITDGAAGNNLHGWTDLLYIYGHSSFPGKSLAELDDNQWQIYLDSINSVDSFSMLANHLSTH